MLIRPLAPSDEAQLRMGLEHLSPRSRYQRFLTPFIHLTDAQVDFLAHPDGYNHIALVMAIETPEQPELHGIAVARCVREQGEHSDAAEVAITVVDEWQGKGVGSLLLRHLARWAIRLGVRRWFGILLTTNEAVKHALDHVGPRIEVQPAERGVLRITWQLDPTVLARQADLCAPIS